MANFEPTAGRKYVLKYTLKEYPLYPRWGGGYL